MKAISAVVLFAALVLSGAAFAGWGAIAYNSSTGANGESHGYDSLAVAEIAALRECGGGCTIMNWEHNSCSALATNSAGAWGEGHGYPNRNAAIAAAFSRCGRGCTLKEWDCS